MPAAAISMVVVPAVGSAIRNSTDLSLAVQLSLLRELPAAGFILSLPPSMDVHWPPACPLVAGTDKAAKSRAAAQRLSLLKCTIDSLEETIFLPGHR